MNFFTRSIISQTTNLFYKKPNYQFGPTYHIETNCQFVPEYYIKTNYQFVPRLYCVAVNSCDRTTPEALRSAVTTACVVDLFTLANCQLYLLLYSLFIGHVTDTSRQPISVQRVQSTPHTREVERRHCEEAEGRKCQNKLSTLGPIVSIDIPSLD